MDTVALALFLTSAIALLGSPGPGIAALLFISRTHGLSAGLRYYAGLQVGLAIAAAASAAGLLSLLSAFPFALRVLTVIASLYLIYLAYRIAASPAGQSATGRQARISAASGMILGITNPKAYIAFASLMASSTLLRSSAQADSVLKWGLCIAVAMIVDLIWVLIGVALRQAALAPHAERILNFVLAAMILAAAVFALA